MAFPSSEKNFVQFDLSCHIEFMSYFFNLKLVIFTIHVSVYLISFNESYLKKDNF